MISPFTLAITRSSTSARVAEAPRPIPTRTRLGRTIRKAECRRMIHLGPLEEGGDDLAHLAVRLLPDQARVDARLRLLEAGNAGRLPGLDTKNMIPERGFDYLAG